MNFQHQSTTCEKVLWSICCIVHQALPPSSSLTPPPEGTVTTTGPNNHQVLLTFRVSLPIFEEKKERENLPPSLPLGIEVLFLFVSISLFFSFLLWLYSLRFPPSAPSRHLPRFLLVLFAAPARSSSPLRACRRRVPSSPLSTRVLFVLLIPLVLFVTVIVVIFVVATLCSTCG